MNKFFILFISAAISLVACKESPKENAETTTETKENTHLVNKTNLAWNNAEELNERVSPPKSAYEKTSDGLEIAIHYSAPAVKHRTVWDSLVPYDQVWRIGANEATVLEISHDIHIADKHIMAGSYGVFCIPKANGWTLILNSVFDQWGAYEYDETKDVARFDLEIKEQPFTEILSFGIAKQENQSLLLSFAWADRGFEIAVEKAMDSAH